MITRNCNYCGKEYSNTPSRIGKFCSRSCFGKTNTKNLTYKIPVGSIPWNKDKGRVETQCANCRKTISVLLSQGTKFCNKKCNDIGQSKPEQSYGTKHNWVRRNFGTPSECEHCKTTESKKFEWANISGEYRLQRSDWARLCCQCHRRYDLGNKNKIEKLNV